MKVVNKLCAYFVPIVGVIFLLSGFLKATDSAAFADLMSQYGAEWFGYLAPAIILGEIVLGLALVFRVYVRPVTWITIAFVVGVTIVFAYGLLFRGITDCGCFGQLKMFNSHPWFTFTRNAILVLLLIVSLVYPPKSNKLSLSVLAFSMVTIGIAAYLCGFSLHGAQILKAQSSPFEPKALQETVLPEFLIENTGITLSSDSTYLVFAFSYTCPYCRNSIGNVEQYEHMNYVDRTIGLAMGERKDSIHFVDLFHPDFEIHGVSKLPRLVSNLPTSFIIRHDTLVNVIPGIAISPSLLMGD